MKKNDRKAKFIAYSVAAGAALAISPNAIAEVISQNVDIDFGGGFGNKYLNMEGTNPEFFLFGSDNYFGLQGTYDNALVHINTAGSYYQIKAIPAGQKVSYSTNTPGPALGAFCYSTNGSWANDNETNYCGISFKLEGGNQTNVYGWLRVVRLSKGTGKIIAWGYEDSGAGITVGSIPEPVSGLALLALGAAGVAAYRKSKEK